RDAEELSRLRTVHQHDLAAASTRQRELDVTIAEESLEALRRQRESADYRRSYYQELIAARRSGWELTEGAARHIANTVRISQGTMNALAAVTALLPQIGSPFSMKYGG